MAFVCAPPDLVRPSEISAQGRNFYRSISDNLGMGAP
jgi:hypothetical protein